MSNEISFTTNIKTTSKYLDFFRQIALQHKIYNEHQEMVITEQWQKFSCN